ncbi:MAG: aminodeoxychorismate synthase, component I, partial [Planctomycetota bacterium]
MSIRVHPWFVPGSTEPFQVLCALREEPLPFFLDSGMDPARLGRFSFVACDPFLVARSRGRRVWVNGDRVGRNPFAVLQRLLREYRRPPAHAPIPFTGGAVGYLAYNLG